VGVGVVGLVHAKFLGLGIHLSEEAIIALDLGESNTISAFFRARMILLLPLKQQSATPNGQCHTRVVAAGQHQAKQQLIHAVYLSMGKRGSCATHTRFHLPNRDLFCPSVDAELLADLKSNNAGHNLGKRSNLLTIPAIKRHDYLRLGLFLLYFIDYIRLGGQFGRRHERLRVIFINLLPNTQLILIMHQLLLIGYALIHRTILFE
jgi:hypothetical protein